MCFFIVTGHRSICSFDQIRIISQMSIISENLSLLIPFIQKCQNILFRFLKTYLLIFPKGVFDIFSFYSKCGEYDW